MHFQVRFWQGSYNACQVSDVAKLGKQGRSNKRLYLDYITPTSNLFLLYESDSDDFPNFNSKILRHPPYVMRPSSHLITPRHVIELDPAFFW
jgi:hypothetical protein